MIAVAFLLAAFFGQLFYMVRREFPARPTEDIMQRPARISPALAGYIVEPFPS